MEQHESNRKAWSEAARCYADQLDESIAFLRTGGTNFVAPEFGFLRPLMPCERAIHLQCAAGHDTLSLWNLGASEVIGLDINEDMLTLAQTKTEALGAPARWIRSDVLATPAELNGTADLVYTGRGALNWLMDIDGWASVVARLLKPGGHLYLFEGHPMSWVWDMEADYLRLDDDYGNYFDERICADESGWPTSYIPERYQPETKATRYERQWTVAQIVNSLIEAGLILEKLGEHPDSYWEAFPNLPEETRSKLPQTLSVLARK
jgi:ubiquinone/menaquinone biosynthesis C-methylase UbiE